VNIERGDLNAADAAARRADAARRAAGVESLPQMLNSWFGTAMTHRALGRLDEAEHDAEAGARVAADFPAAADSLLLAVPVTIELGRIRLARGDLAGARAALADARTRLLGATDAGKMTTWLAEADQALGEASPATSAKARRPADTELSSRELSVLQMLTGTGSLREVSDALFVSQNTLKTHCRTIYRKLGASSREEAVARARQRGLL
jgi:LuxR family maltose regulon positive regulatory protein